MAVTFHKMHGAGNDFVLLDLRRQSFRLDAERARSIADRHTGVGCDQVLALRPPSGPPSLADFEIWNADGSRAEQCGNGVRCIARYLQENGEATGGAFQLGGPLAIVTAECLADGQVRVDMGVPEFDPARIPVNSAPTGDCYTWAANGKDVSFGAVSMGNPHAVVCVADLRKPDIDHLGPSISRSELFPEGCNAGFAEIVNRRRIRLRVFERGAGETRACGSGACAAVAVLRKAGLVDKKVQVLQDGGTLSVEWPGNHAPLMMTGPAIHVFEGTLK